MKYSELRSQGVGDSGKHMMVLNILIEILMFWKLLIFSFTTFLQSMWRVERSVLCKLMEGTAGIKIATLAITLIV